jgi:N-acetylglucosamine-6-phosphate deacetylase
MLELVGRRYDSDRAVRIQIEKGHISRITPAEDAPGLPYVAPGFCDLQINGYQGVEFNDPKLTVEQVRKAALSQDQFGVTRYLATCTTDSYEVFRHSFATIAQAINELPEVAARIAGIHMEGPYIASEDGPRGAHPKQHVRPPDWDEFSRIQQAAKGKIKLLTVSPEYEGSAKFIKRVVESGVLVAIGHTKATTEQISAAVDAGARMSTHLGNGAHPQIKRHPNYIWDQLAEDRLTASLITDGHHLPSAVVKSMVRAKTPARCVLVSDITGLAGMPPGRYSTGLGDLEVLENGKLVLAGQRDILAGASQPIHVCVANAMRFAGVCLPTAVEMASSSPLRLIGESDRGLEVGEAANLVLFDLPKDASSPLKIRMTVSRGEVVYKSQ